MVSHNITYNMKTNLRILNLDDIFICFREITSYKNYYRKSDIYNTNYLRKIFHTILKYR